MKQFLRSVTWQLIINPNSLSSKCLNYSEPIKDLLIRQSIRFESHIVGDCITCQKRIEKLCREGKRHFFVFGGDGTLNEVVNTIFKTGIDTSEVYVIPFPLGTGNDWCRTHLYPRKAIELPAVLESGSFVRHDVGKVEVIRGNELAETRFFINIAGFGFDADVIRQTVDHKTKYFSSATYLVNLLKVLYSHKAKELKVSSSDFTVSESVFSMAVGICQYNGNGMKQVPMADPTDGFFDVVVIKDIKPKKVLRNVKNLYSGAHIDNLDEISVYKTNELVVETNPYELCEVEGEMLQKGNYRVVMLPQAINLLTFR